MSRTFALALAAVVSALSFAACGGGGSDSPAVPRPTLTNAATQCTAAPLAGLTWANFGSAFFTTNCVLCHNGLGGPGLPPPTVAFRTYAEVVTHVDHIDEHAAANPNGSVVNTFMPPGGGLPLVERQKLACWIASGFPE